MAAPPQTRTRRLDSYERACELLRAQPLQPDQGTAVLAGVFADVSFDEIKRVAARSLPPPVRLVAFPLKPTPTRPARVAEFAAELLLQRHGQRLTLATPQARPKYGERANLRWIIWGDLIASPGGHFALGPLSIGPYPGAEHTLEPGASPYRGITSEVLRALPIEHLIHQIVVHLQPHPDWQQRLTEKHGQQTPIDHRQLIADAVARVNARPEGRARAYPEHHYHDVALLYLNLLETGHGRNVLVQLADLLGISHQTARNWVHRARQLGYLTPGTQGRAGALPGTQLSTPD